MNELKIFEHPKFGKIRTIVEDGKTLFSGSDAASALGYKDPAKAIRTHCRWGAKRPVPHPQNPEKMIEMTFITEGDLCRLAAKSELPGANEFESWIFDEVIPSVLRTGTYSVAPPTPHRPPEVSPSGLAKLITVTRRIMLDMGGTPVQIGLMARDVFQAYNFPVPTALSKQLEGQISFYDPPALSA